jgi:hypothetical protein
MPLVRLDNKLSAQKIQGATLSNCHLERDGRPEREHRVSGQRMRGRPREFVFQDETIFPDRPGSANGETGSKTVCCVVLRNAIDVGVTAIVVTRADSRIPSLADVVTVKGGGYCQRVLREPVVSR